MKVFFSCMGTSDPVRGYRDGPLLHILRHYRPEKAVILLTDEVGRLNNRAGSLTNVAAFLRAHWDGYAPQFVLIPTNITDPSDLDAVSAPIQTEIQKLSAMHPDAALLLNLSSGTPQMKQVLSMIAADVRYPHVVGVQVKNPEKAAGSTERTNRPDYSVGDELECNEDEEPGADNRCSEPQLLHLRRKQATDQILALLDGRNYAAIYAMQGSMPEDVKALVGHLEARDRLQTDVAQKRAQNLKLPFSLYPRRQTRERSDYDEISEAYLILLNRRHRKQFEEMVLRLNPLVVRLQLRLIGRILASIGMRLEEIISRPYSPHPKFYPSMLENKLPEVYESVCKSFGGTLRDISVNMTLCNRLLEALPEVPPDALALLKKCEDMNSRCRNELAHQLTGVTAEQLKDSCGLEPAQLLRMVGDLIAELYPECDKKLFGVYEQRGRYISTRLK